MLYFVATPIGNLKDITLRALEVLKSVDIIACEDTRKTSILLKTYDIKKRTIAYHKNNEFTSANGIIELLKKGKDVAVVSDAGMPTISDPGEILISKLKEENLSYTIIPGASAGLSALVLSGFDASNFTFVGFLPEKQKNKIELLEHIKTFRSTLIFYIAPHNLFDDIAFLFEHLGNRKACLVKEITKMFENTYFFNLGDKEIPNLEVKGEFVLIVEKAPNVSHLQNLTLDEQIEFYINSGLDKKHALKKVAKENKIDNIYNYIKK